MHTRQLVQSLEAQYGVPLVGEAEAVFAAREFGLVQRCGEKGRAHDVSLLIHDGEGRFALIRKPWNAPDIFRPPTGGIEPEETLEAGAAREAREETGLEIRLQRYLLRVDARFTCSGDTAPWTTHVFLAEALTRDLDPQDAEEIAEARWASVDEILNRYRPELLAMRSEGMRYRVELLDASLRLLGLADPPPTGAAQIITWR